MSSATANHANGYTHKLLLAAAALVHSAEPENPWQCHQKGRTGPKADIQCDSAKGPYLKKKSSFCLGRMPIMYMTPMTLAGTRMLLLHADTWSMAALMSSGIVGKNWMLENLNIVDTLCNVSEYETISL